MLSDKELVRPGLMEIPFPEPAGAGPLIREKLFNWEGLDSLRLPRSRSSGMNGSEVKVELAEQRPNSPNPPIPLFLALWAA